jgi:hypothetical protein
LLDVGGGKNLKLKLIVVLFSFLYGNASAHAACGGTLYTWTAGAGTTTWTTNNNWNPNTGYPGQVAGNRALIQSASQVPVWPAASYSMSCFQVSSGRVTMTPAAARTLTITGDYFRNLNLGSITTSANMTFIMAGTAAQTFENVDTINRLTINNNVSVELTETFTVSTAFTISSTAGTIYIDKHVTVTPAFTIPAGVTVEIKNGGTLTAGGNITVNGVLRIMGGGKLDPANGITVTVAAGGSLLLQGAPGNVASIDGGGGQSFGLVINGSMTANYFMMSRCRNTTPGVRIYGTVTQMDNGEFHYLVTQGMTLESGAVLPTTWNNISFYDDSNNGSVSINATNYGGGATDLPITINNWAGISTKTDPNNCTPPGGSACVTFGTAAPVAIQVTDSSNAPPASPINPSTTQNFGAFGFNLNQAATAATVTSITVTLDGNNVASDVSSVNLYWNTTGSCAGGTVGPTWAGTFTGSPPTAVIPITSSPIILSNTTKYCLQAYLTTSATPRNNDTIGVMISATADVTNSQGYTFSTTSGPPVSLGLATITGGSAVNYWQGDISTAWATATNWSTGAVPTNATDCQVGAGFRVPTFAAGTTINCQNATLPSGGQIDFGNQLVTFAIRNSIEVDPTYTFTNGGSAVLNFNGTTQETVDFDGGTWPGSVTVNNAAGVNLASDWTISGNLTITSGTLIIPAGKTLTVGGTTLAVGGAGTPAGLTISPGATLVFTNAATPALNVGINGTLTMVGNSSLNAVVTSDATNHPYNITLNGNASTTISANYYTLENLGATGLTIGTTAQATINGTNYLQNGTFSYPAANNATFLTLNQKIPGNTLSGMTFDSAGSSATNTMAVLATASVAAPLDALTINTYTGDRSGSSYSTDGTNYTITWGTTTNTLKLTQQVSTTPSTISRGATVTMGEWGFQETTANGTATDITSIKITMTGTASAGDVTAARLYQDTACDGTVGSQLGTSQTMSGSPASATFSGITYNVPAGATPSVVCVILQMDIAGSAAAGTIGAQISLNSDVSNTQGYVFNGSYAPAVTLGSPGTISGTSTTWTGNASTTVWTTVNNWSNGVPNTTIDCTIANTSFDPVITAGLTANCKNLTIASGAILTMNATGGATTLNVYGDFTNNGTFTQGGQTFVLRETGTATTQSIYGSGTFTLSSLTFNKAVGGGAVRIYAPGLTITTLTFSGNFTFDVMGGGTLILPNGVSIPANIVFELEQNSVVQIGNGQTLTVAGGTFKVDGAQSTYPNQTLANSGEVTVSGAGSWNFNATSGTVDLTGWVFDKIGTGGAVIGNGTASVTLSNLRYGQFINLTTATTNTLRINTTGSIPTTATDIGWNWQGLNSMYLGGTSPAPTDGYSLASSTGCGGVGVTLTFIYWFGDWYAGVNTPVPNSKVSNTNCNLTIDPAQSPVSLVSFDAVPYDSAVVLNWMTGLEWNHQGFNVYRSLSPDTGFAQINSSLIRNAIISSTAHGTYQFYDTSVLNGVTYYYRIEDIATNGTRKLHGPVSATPLPTLPPPPAPNGSSIVGSGPGSTGPGGGPGGNPPTAFAPGIKQLAPGVHLLASTDHAMRLQIDIPAPSFTASLTPPYQKVAIDGYSLMTETGKPELPQRIIMLEIPAAQTAAHVLIKNIHSTQGGIDIAPSPAWIPSGGILVPTWSLDSAFYATNQNLPSSPVSLGTITTSQGSYYLPVIVQPIAANPATHTIDVTSQIVVDIELDGVPLWSPVSSSPGNIWGTEGGLKISISKEGLYQLTYEDFEDAGVDGAFATKDFSRFKLYSTSTELPLDVVSVNSGSFGPGDKIIFFAPYFDNAESTKNNLILIADSPSSSPGLRMSTLDGNPSLGLSTTEQSFPSLVHAEENTFENLGAPYAEGLDHIFWAQFMDSTTDHSQSRFSADVILPKLIHQGSALIIARVAGSYGYNYAPGMHHIRLWLNSSTTSAGDDIFFGNEPYTAVFNVPASALLSGLNRITFEAVGDMNNGDYDVILLDWFEVTYPHAFEANNDVGDVRTGQVGSVLSVSDFSANDLMVYDVSDLGLTAKLSNIVIGGSGPYSASFTAPNVDGDHGRHFWIASGSNIPKPDSIVLNPGSSLSESSQSADALFIGTAENLDAVLPLADLRTRQGFNVKMIDIEDIYSEFGQGLYSADAIKDFIKFAATQWALPALKYVILVGDGSNDPKDTLGHGVQNHLPVRMMKGSALDYPSDNWFVSWNPSDDLPSLSIGRIPGNTPALITSYVNKVLAYEEGSSRPVGQAAKNITLIADIDQLGEEGFAPRVSTLASQITGINSSLSPQILSRVSSTDAQLKQDIVSSFNSGAVIINYFGHGAENIWAANSVFTNSDADALSNTVYPVVVTMDCMNAAFSYADGYQTLADRLLFNKNGGAVALWGSTSMTSSSWQAPYQTALYQVIASHPEGIRLGEAIRLAKINAGWDPAKAEVLRSMTLLGDPMLNVITPAPLAPPKNDSDSGGSFGCGSISSSGNGKGGGPGAGALAEISLLMMLFVGAWRMSRRVGVIS